MLAEGYLYKLQSMYEDDIKAYRKRASKETKEVAGVCTLNYISAYETGSRRVFNKRYGSAERRDLVALGQSNAESITEKRRTEGNMENDPSLLVSAEINSQSNKDTYLVPSSCKNICMDYNDLHVAGDQVMAINSVMTDFTSDSSFEYCEGPFLQSSQIPSAMDSLATNNLPRKISKRDSSCWKSSSLKDKSITNPEQPLSNSVLNEYLEQKVIELYKQYMMDISCSASPTQILTSEMIMNNVQQISMQLSREQNMETNKAKGMVISYLLRLASEKQSHVISTPNLQISSNLT
ncbi:TLR adapter interacting with SLC15A4 on the lysosome [Gastrophryne carolinensis]